MIISAPAAFSSDAFALSGIIGADALIIPKKAPLVKVETVFEQRIIASYLIYMKAVALRRLPSPYAPDCFFRRILV